MTFDPLRGTEATLQAAVVLGTVVVPPAWHALDSSLAAVLAAMLALLASGVYALHAVTFDLFRLTGQRGRQRLTFTRGED